MAVAGRLFEKNVLQVLQRVRFQLVQLGGANDGGVDLRGVWALPDNTSIPVIAQCKVRVGALSLLIIEGNRLL